MISVVIRAEQGAAPLAVTLGALVPGVAAGLIGDAVVLAGRDDDGIARVADAMGAILLVGSDTAWARGAAAARRDWVLCLSDGDVPGEGWIRGLEQFIALCPPGQGFGRLMRRPSSWRRRLLSWPRADQVRAGDLVRRELFGQGRGRLGRPVRVSACIERGPAFG